MQSTHDFDVEGLQSMACRLDEVNAGVNPVVDNIHAVDLVLCVQIGVITELDILHNGAPGVVVVDEVAKAGCVHHSQAKSHPVLLDVGADGLDGYGLGNDIESRTFALSWRIERGVEEGVDQRGLAKSRFTCEIVRS